MNKTKYESDVQNRTVFHFYLGLLARLKKYITYTYVRFVAKQNGATIGRNSVLPLSLAKKANSNLTIGANSSIQTDLVDLRAKVKIGNNVIIGSGVEILTCSHEIDSPDWEFKPYGVEIDDYAWIAAKVFILPSCRKIARGAICGAGSVVIRNVEEMSVISGNPAIHIKYRKYVHSNLVVESLLGADLTTYIETWNHRK